MKKTTILIIALLSMSVYAKSKNSQAKLLSQIFSGKKISKKYGGIKIILNGKEFIQYSSAKGVRYNIRTDILTFNKNSKIYSPRLISTKVDIGTIECEGKEKGCFYSEKEDENGNPYSVYEKSAKFITYTITSFK